MIEVLYSFECKTNTFFVAVELLDSFLKETDESLEANTIHILGIVSMLIASKIEEVSPFSVSMVAEKISHGKILKEDLVNWEIKFTEILGFRLLRNPNLFVFTELILVKMNYHTFDFWNEIANSTRYVTTMALFDYLLLQSYSLEYLGCGCVYLAFKILEQTRDDLQVHQYIDEMMDNFNLNERIFFAVSESLLCLAKKFDNSFKFAKNLRHYVAFTPEETSDYLSNAL